MTDDNDNALLQDVATKIATGNMAEAIAVLKNAGMTHEEADVLAGRIKSQLNELREGNRKQAIRDYHIETWLFFAGCAIVAALCFYVFGWIYELSTCIAGLSIGSLCLIDTVLLTAIGSLGLTAAATLFASFLKYLFSLGSH